VGGGGVAGVSVCVCVCVVCVRVETEGERAKERERVFCLSMLAHLGVRFCNSVCWQTCKSVCSLFRQFDAGKNVKKGGGRLWTRVKEIKETGGV